MTATSSSATCETGDVEHVTPHERVAEYFSVQWLGERLVLTTNEGRDTFAIVIGGERVHESDWDLDVRVDDSGRNVLVHRERGRIRAARRCTIP